MERRGEGEREKQEERGKRGIKIPETERKWEIDREGTERDREEDRE